MLFRSTDVGIAAPASGYMVSRVVSGSRCDSSQTLADIVDIDGIKIDQIRAPQEGYLMMRRRDARVNVGDTALIFATTDRR